MKATLILMTKCGMIEAKRVIVDSAKADEVFKQLIRDNDSYATEDEIEDAMENCYHDGNGGTLNITIDEVEIEGEI